MLDSGSSELSARFPSFFQHIAGLEGRSVEDRSRRLTHAVKDVLPVDATQEDPLGGGFSQADVVFSHLCLEYIVCDRKKFIQNVKNVVNVVKPGGFLVLQSALGADSYHVGDVKFPSTNTDREFLEECVDEAGLEMIEYEEFSSPTVGEKYAKHSGVYSMVARKKY